MHPFYRLFFPLITLLFWGHGLLLSQDYLANVQFYNHENGLAGRFANCTFKDSRGLIWIGTQFGLNRFDGRDFLLFNEASGLPFPQVMEIHEDSEGWLWLFRNCFHKQGCTRNLAFLHSITHEVHTFEEHLGDKVDFRPEDVVSIVTNEFGDVFLSAERQVVQWSGEEILRKIDLTGLAATPNLLCVLGADRLAGWYHAENETNNDYLIYLAFDLHGKTQHSQIVPNQSKKNAKDELQLIGRDHLGRKMVSHSYAFDDADPHFVLRDDGKLLRDTSAWSNYPNPQDFFYDPFHPVAWQYGSDGLNVFTLSGGLVYRFGDEFPELGKNRQNRQIRFDGDHITWLSGRYGVFRIQFRPNPFQRVLYNPLPDLESPIKNICQGVTPIGNGKLLLSTQQFGFYEKQSGTPAPPVRLEKKEPGAVPVTLSKGYQGDYWGVQYSILHRLTKIGGDYSFERQSFEQGKAFNKTLSQYSKGNRLWLGTDKGLHYFDHKQLRFLNLANYNGFDELKESTVHQIYEENGDRIWLCTSSGLYLFNVEKGIQERYWEGGNSTLKIPGTAFYQILPAEQGGWWLASQQGLVLWNPDKNTTQLFTTKDGLAANEILAIHEDGYGFLWLATDAGLVQYQTGTSLSMIWLKADGISSNDFEPYTYYCQEDGTVWFGSTNGYTVFHPKDFKDIDFTAQPDIRLNILDFEQFSIETNKLENRTNQLLKNQQITLQPGEQLFNLRIALADYVNGADAKYTYRILGFQDFWQEGKENLIRISGLPYGNFTLEIKGRLANGQYSSQEIHLPIRILKPFYLKTWFLIFAMAVIFCSVFLWFKWRTSQMKERQIQLERTVQERTEELKKDKETIQLQAKELRLLDKLKSRFFANVSHELRTPLTLMLGPVHSLLKRKKRDGEETKLLQFIQRNAQQLQKLINEILDLSKLEDNKLEVIEKPVLFYPYLKDQMAQFHSFAASMQQEFDMKFEADESLQILLDKNKFEKIVHNFLSNALKFTPPSGKVALKVEQLGNHLQVSVSDTGRGIHPDDQPHIFDRFYQAPSRPPQNGEELSSQIGEGWEGAEGGTGIGLSLCKELAELLGGKVWAESELGKGSVFYFKFPKVEVTSLGDGHETMQKGVNSEPTIALEPEMTPFPFPTKPLLKDVTSKPGMANILIVEDNADLREYLQFLLSDYQVFTTANGKEALEWLTADDGRRTTDTNRLPSAVRRQPDLIISDLMMPVMDGFQFLEKLKSDDRWRHLPIIMLTAKVNARAKLRALRIGVDDYLTKPFQEEELIVRIENLLGNYRKRMEMFSKMGDGTLGALDKNRPVIAEVDAEWLKEVEAVFEKHFGDPGLSVERAAWELHLSIRQFQRRLKMVTGLSPIQYIREMRLQKAKDYLLAGKYATVQKTALATGFKDARYFSELFQKHFAVSPSSFLR